jgi:hypothetical protein
MSEHTTLRGYPLPHPDHLLLDDVLRLREAMTAIDTDMAQNQSATEQLGAQINERLQRQQLRVFHQFNF